MHCPAIRAPKLNNAIERVRLLALLSPAALDNNRLALMVAQLRRKQQAGDTAADNEYVGCKMNVPFL